MNPGLVMYEEEFRKISGICDRLTRDAGAKVVFLVDKNGQLIASVGMEPEFDLMSFASLCAADFEANAQLAKLIGEKDFSTLYHQGVDESMYLARVAEHIILVVLFNKRTTLGLVRLRVKKAVDGLDTVLSRLFDKLEYENEDLKQFDAGFADELNKEIDSLFKD